MHLLVIFFIALLVLGPKKLPELGKGIGHRGNHKNPRLCMCEHDLHDVLW